VKYGTASA